MPIKNEKTGISFKMVAILCFAVVAFGITTVQTFGLPACNDKKAVAKPSYQCHSGGTHACEANTGNTDCLLTVGWKMMPKTDPDTCSTGTKDDGCQTKQVNCMQQYTCVWEMGTLGFYVCKYKNAVAPAEYTQKQKAVNFECKDE